MENSNISCCYINLNTLYREYNKNDVQLVKSGRAALDYTPLWIRGVKKKEHRAMQKKFKKQGYINLWVGEISFIDRMFMKFHLWKNFSIKDYEPYGRNVVKFFVCE